MKKKFTLKITSGQQLAGDMGTAALVDDRLFVPVRYISEYFGANVDWDANTQTVIITKRKKRV
jgi:hypothetical protein